MMRRSLDLLVSGVALLVFSPILVIIPLLIKWEDGGPILFRQVRLGKGKGPLTIWKFRSMEGGKVTRTGRWIRATALDEYLQLFLVFRGDMTLVGPRPLTKTDVDRLGWTTEAHAPRWAVRPGVTGFPQVFGSRSSDEAWSWDRHYVEQRTIGLDLQIILLSGLVNILGKRRVRRWFVDHYTMDSVSRRLAGGGTT
ncbi:MAG: sugar transferase [Verrucomicrobiota bacterium]